MGTANRASDWQEEPPASDLERRLLRPEAPGQAGLTAAAGAVGKKAGVGFFHRS